MKLLLVGGGSKEKEYKDLAESLNIHEQTFFAGRIPHNNLVKYFNMIDIFVNVSRNESFGVSVLEASACERPVVLTSVGGLTEVAVEGITGLFVPVDNVDALVEALEKLILSNDLRKKLGSNGRKKVIEEFEFEKCLQKQISFYKEI